MERTALAFVQTIDSAENLGEEPPGFGAAGEQMTVISVRREKVVVAAQTGNRRHTGSFLTDVQVIVAAEYSLVVERHQVLFEMANDQHAPA